MARDRLAIVLILSVVACGGDGTTGPSPAPSGQPASIAVHSGDNQTARIGTLVPIPPAVIVRDASNRPVGGASVTFAVETGGGSVSGATAVTNSSGIATVGAWTLGPAKGTNTLVAAAEGLPGKSARFTATTRYPYWTVMVYMAADNDLAVEGIFDIDEMEAAGVDPEVQVVVQAEFNPIHLAFEGCDASCFNRPNFNTFRYAIKGQGQDVFGPNGAAIDLGNRDMTDPAQLREFISWSKENYPAERYALVLWNHGGGYTGLIQDITSAGGDLMSIGELSAALGGVGAIDVLDFDMCNMAGYETLVTVAGLVRYAVFSEEVVPGAGNPYQEVIDGIQANAAADGQTIAEVFVERFHAAYQGDRASTTKSAYDMTGFANFEATLNTLAATLRNSISTLGLALADAAARSQQYEIWQLKDLVNFLDSLRVRTTDATLQSQIDAVKAQATGNFRVRNRFRNGSASTLGGARDVSRSTGLHIVMPSGIAGDRLPNAGPGSFSAYQAIYGGKPWTLFLAEWLAAQAPLAYTDQGNSRFQGYLVWDSAAVSRQADVDLWILEPNGYLFIPYLGSITPNGTFTSDSYDDRTFWEGYLTNRFVQNGTYRFYANLWIDPNDYRPVYDFQFRLNQTSGLSSLYAPNFPRLSRERSWLNDPTPTFEELDAGAYTDLQFFATLTYGAGPSATVSRSAMAGGLWAGRAPDTSEPRPTAAQLSTIRELLAERQSTRVPSGSRAVPDFLRAVPGEGRQ